MIYLKSVILILSFLSFNFSTIPQDILNCETAIQVAKKDYANNKLKYYTFGITQFSPKKITKLNIGPKIAIVPLGCIVNNYQICYNQYVDSLLVAQTGMNFYDLRN